MLSWAQLPGAIKGAGQTGVSGQQPTASAGARAQSAYLVSGFTAPPFGFHSRAVHTEPHSLAKEPLVTQSGRAIPLPHPPSRSSGVGVWQVNSALGLGLGAWEPWGCIRLRPQPLVCRGLAKHSHLPLTPLQREALGWVTTSKGFEL